MDLEQMFALPQKKLEQIVRDFHAEMERGLAGEESSLQMIPCYVTRASGKEQGRFIALDLGGTNFRVLGLDLFGNGKSKMLAAKKFTISKKHMEGHGDDLFDFIADCIKRFLVGEKISGDTHLDLGFTFSFPVAQAGIASGTLVNWSKGFITSGVVGNDVVELLNKALARAGLANVTVAALANDTVGTLVAKSYEEPEADVGVILGTGTNACYPEKLENIPAWTGPPTSSGKMIVNIEWGNFNKVTMTKYGKKLDQESNNPGQHILEKMVSGMYLGEICRLVFQDVLEDKTSYREPYSYKTEYMSKIAAEKSNDLIARICSLVARRSARIAAAALAAVVTKMDPQLENNHLIAIDGSLYEKYPGYKAMMNEALLELLGEKAAKIKMVLAKDGSGKGAAVIAAVAVQDKI